MEFSCSKKHRVYKYVCIADFVFIVCSNHITTTLLALFRSVGCVFRLNAFQNRSFSCIEKDWNGI